MSFALILRKTLIISILSMALGLGCAGFAFADDEALVIESADGKQCNVGEEEVKKLIELFAPDGKKVPFGRSQDDMSRILEKRETLRVVSSYKTNEIAKEVITAALLFDIKRIGDWLNSRDSKNVIYLNYKVNRNIGHGLYRGAQDPIEMNTVLIVVRKDVRKCTFSVVSSYPCKGKDKPNSAVDLAEPQKIEDKH
jgi:hypothetical protein